MVCPISLLVRIIVADEVGKVQVQTTMKTIWHYRRIFLPCSRYGLSLSIMFSLFSVAQSTVPSSHEEPLSVDLSDSHPICMRGSSNLVFVLTESCES
jgi:hypothetical protein